MKKIELQDIVVLPQTNIRGIHKGKNTFTFGPLVTDNSFDFVHHFRSSALVTNVEEMRTQNCSPLKKLNGSYFYCGAMDYHFGHFISECIGRLYAWESSPQSIPLWCPTWREGGFDWTENLPKWQIDVLAYLGLDFRVMMYVTAPTVVDSLTIAESGAWLYSTPKPELINWLVKRQNRFAKTVSKSSCGIKIFVSRGRLNRNLSGRLSCIEGVESRLKSCGYSVIYPEELSIREQLELYAGAKQIVFENGSAIHLLELFGKFAADIAILPRNPGVGSAFKKVLTPRATGLIWTYQGKVWSEEPNSKEKAIRQQTTGVCTEELLQCLSDAEFIN